MAEYKLNKDGGVVRTDGAYIPEDVANRDYLLYLQWLDAGNMPESADQAPPREIRLSPSQQIILADGADIATVTITGEPGGTIIYTVNGDEQSLVLTSGTDTIELTCDTPSTTLLVQAGTAKAVIYAVEVPS